MKLKKITFTHGLDASRYLTMRDNVATEVLDRHAEWQEWEDWMFYALFDDRTLGRITQSKQTVEIRVWTQEQRLEVFLGKRRIANEEFAKRQKRLLKDFFKK